MKPNEHLMQPGIEVTQVLKIIETQFVPDRRSARPRSQVFYGVETWSSEADENAWYGVLCQPNGLSRSSKSPDPGCSYAGLVQRGCLPTAFDLVFVDGKPEDPKNARIRTPFCNQQGFASARHRYA